MWMRPEHCEQRNDDESYSRKFASIRGWKFRGLGADVLADDVGNLLRPAFERRGIASFEQ